MASDAALLDAGRPPRAGDANGIMAVRADPLQQLTEAARQHGDTFAYATAAADTVVLNHPAFARHVLVDRADRYAKAGTPELAMLRTVLGDGLMTVEGPEWVAQRTAATPAFSEARLRGYFPAMKAEVETTLARWAAASTAPIEIGDDLSALTLRIVARCLFEASLSPEETHDVGTGVGALNEFMANGPKEFRPQAPERRGSATTDSVPKFPDPRDSAAVRASHQRAMEKMAGIVWSIAVGAPPVDRETPSLLAVLRREAGGTEDLKPVIDQVLTFLMAGHETTAKALTWTLHLLSTRPEVQARLQQTVDALPGASFVPEEDGWGYNQMARLGAVESVLHEAMRLYPPVWLISRKAVRDDVVGGFAIDRGALVVISPYLLHRHPHFWTAPQAFDPQRFAAGGGAEMRACLYMPFGAGARSCIGRRFAMAEMLMFLAMLLRRFDIRPFSGADIRPEALVTLRPASPVRVRLVPRNGRLA